MDAPITVAGGDNSVQTPLLDDVVDGVVNFKGQSVGRSRSGGWRSASFIIGVEVAERFAFYGISSNLITYLTGPLGQSTASAAENVNAWSGAASLSPLLGAFIADSFLGRFRTIFISSLLYILGLGLLTLSAVLFPNPECEKAVNDSLSSLSSCSSPPKLQVILFFFSLYLVAFAQGGHKPCVQAFGADQFDSNDEKESKSKSSFFNWWYFALCAGTLSTLLILNYIQDNLNWGLGFGIPCIVMGFALVVFLLGTSTYRFTVKDGHGHRKSSPFVRIGKVFVTAVKNRRNTTGLATSHEEEASGILQANDSEQFKFLNKALLSPEESNKICTNDVEEAKSVLRLVPIWASCLVYAVVFAQSPTLFTKQGATMDRSIGSNFKIPPATLQSFISLSIVILIPIYDRVFVPITRMITHRTSGITMLQRIGIGIALSILSMVVAAKVEAKRLNVAQTSGLIEEPNLTVLMSVWWLAPQYLLFGVSDVFTMVGLQEFFYDQIPSELKSLGLALYLSIFGVGSFISSFLISIIDKTTTSSDGGDGWFSDNLNKGHLDYFYWLLASISTVAFMAYLLFAKSYTYNRAKLPDYNCSTV